MKNKRKIVIVGALIFFSFLIGLLSGWRLAPKIPKDETSETSEAEGVISKELPKRKVRGADDVWTFKTKKRELPRFYQYKGEKRVISDFLQKTNTQGLIVVSGEDIVHESYYQDRDKNSTFQTRSVAGSFLSILVGIALEDGDIDSIDDPVSEYTSRLDGTAYENIKIRRVLGITTGIYFSPEYSSDFIEVLNKTFKNQDKSLLDYYFSETVNRWKPGEYVSPYGPPHDLVTAAVLVGATGENLSSYMEEKLWQPLGAQDDAFWELDGAGREIAFGFFNATLRDYARFARLLLNNGQRGEEKIVSGDWIEKVTSPQEVELAPEVNEEFYARFNYGYNWFIPKERVDREFLSEPGAQGQYIYINPRWDVVIVKFSELTDYKNYHDETMDVFRTIAEHYGEGA